MSITRTLFGKKPDGAEVFAYTLANKNGMSAKILNMGGILVSLNVPNKDGKIDDIICGFDTVEGYLNGGGYQGALIGRIGNRIGGAAFKLDGVKYDLFKNDGNNHLHGGKEGFNVKIWDARAFEKSGDSYLELTYTSADGEENYPGTLKVTVTYTLTADNKLSIHYVANTDKRTIINMTNHAYYNLSGYTSGNIHGHELQINADYISDVANSELIPTGKDIAVEGTVFDFRKPKLIGKDIEADDKLLKMGGGYDHNFILAPNTEMKKVAVLSADGRTMTVFTTEPCIQLYTANMIDESLCAFKGNFPQKKRCAVCLETQHKPDSINHQDGTVYTDVILDPDKTYDTETIYAFN